jgi:hypothetical protein
MVRQAAMMPIPDKAAKPARCSTTEENTANAALDIRIAVQENDVPSAKPVAALSASRMITASKTYSPLHPSR